jgi:hypothetical protein
MDFVGMSCGEVSLQIWHVKERHNRLTFLKPPDGRTGNPFMLVGAWGWLFFSASSSGPSLVRRRFASFPW